MFCTTTVGIAGNVLAQIDRERARERIDGAAGFEPDDDRQPSCRRRNRRLAQTPWRRGRMQQSRTSRRPQLLARSASSVPRIAKVPCRLDHGGGGGKSHWRNCRVRRGPVRRRAGFIHVASLPQVHRDQDVLGRRDDRPDRHGDCVRRPLDRGRRAQADRSRGRRRAVGPCARRPHCRGSEPAAAASS